MPAICPASARSGPTPAQSGGPPKVTGPLPGGDLVGDTPKHPQNLVISS